VTTSDRAQEKKTIVFRQFIKFVADLNPGHCAEGLNVRKVKQLHDLLVFDRVGMNGLGRYRTVTRKQYITVHSRPDFCGYSCVFVVLSTRVSL
jgi:hypothetical protein